MIWELEVTRFYKEGIISLSKRFKKILRSVNIYPGAYVNTDHRLLLGRVGVQEGRKLIMPNQDMKINSKLESR